MDPEKQRQRRHDGVTESGNARSEQLLVVPTESLTGQQTTAARRTLEWISMSKARLVFRYEISDLFQKPFRVWLLRAQNRSDQSAPAIQSCLDNR